MDGRRTRFSQIVTYAVYYGRGEVLKLSQFDCVIVEPMARTKQEIEVLQQHQTLVIAYVSVMEAGSFHDVWPFLQEEDFLYVQGERIAQPLYNTYLLDLQSVRWRKLLVHQIGSLLYEQGYDGVFFDTIGDVERMDLPNQPQQLAAAADIVAELRGLFSDRIFIQNNGLDMLCLQTAPFLDGIVWENPPVAIHNSQAWLVKIANRLRDLAQKYPLRPMVLFEQEDPNQNPNSHLNSHRGWVHRRQFADQFGFPVYFAARHYVADVKEP